MDYLIVTGSRQYKDFHHIEKVIREVHQMALQDSTELLVFHGGANGADTLAAQAVQNLLNENSQIIGSREIKAQWKLHDKMAGFIRNEEMVGTTYHQYIHDGDETTTDRIFGAAFYIHTPTRGTQDCHARMLQYGIPVRVYREDQLVDYTPPAPVHL